MEQGQPLPPVQRLRGHTQPFQIARHIGLYPFQAGPGLPDPPGWQAECNVLGTLNAVVAFGDLIF